MHFARDAEVETTVIEIKQIISLFTKFRFTERQFRKVFFDHWIITKSLLWVIKSCISNVVCIFSDFGFHIIPERSYCTFAAIFMPPSLRSHISTVHKGVKSQKC